MILSFLQEYWSGHLCLVSMSSLAPFSKHMDRFYLNIKVRDDQISVISTNKMNEGIATGGISVFMVIFKATLQDEGNFVIVNYNKLKAFLQIETAYIMYFFRNSKSRKRLNSRNFAVAFNPI